jgi:hypothetical protein
VTDELVRHLRDLATASAGFADTLERAPAVDKALVYTVARFYDSAAGRLQAVGDQLRAAAAHTEAWPP